MTIEHRTHRPYIAMGLDQQGRLKTGVHIKPDSETRIARVIYGGVVVLLAFMGVVAVLAKAASFLD